jgi:hypothetical protein
MKENRDIVKAFDLAQSEGKHEGPRDPVIYEGIVVRRRMIVGRSQPGEDNGKEKDEIDGGNPTR